MTVMTGQGDKFIIDGLAGAKTLAGTVQIGGAKNEILKVLCAAPLFKDGFSLTNVPEIEDVRRVLELLKRLGAAITKDETDKYSIEVNGLDKFSLPEDISKKLRASIVITGPLLARFGQVDFPYPGGCVIGKRPIDMFLAGFKKMGAEVIETGENFTVKASNGKLQGAELFFKNQSVTVTETFMLAGILAEGKTILKNCATEPEIESLGEWLNECGAKISGLGTNTLTIEGGELLSGAGKVHETLPDRIEAGSFLLLGALAARELTITNCRPEHLDALINLLKEARVKIETGQDWIKVAIKETLLGNHQGVPLMADFNAVDIKTHEYPGFPTDLQAPFSIFLTQAVGQSFIFETIFEGRLNYLEALNRMGAKAKILDAHRAIIDGPTPLSAHEIASPDLRAGLAYILAAIVASGQSVVHNVEYVDRGYERIEERLRLIGVKIERIKAPASDREEDLCQCSLLN